MNGGTPKTKVEEYWGGDHQWITPAEMGKREVPYVGESQRTLSDDGLAASSASLIPPYSVILSTRAPIGHLVINTEPMAFNQGCRGIVPGPSVDHKYLYYFLFANVGLLNDLGTGATFKELSAGKLKAVELPVPSLPEQERIVAILDEAFAAIDKAMANTERNLANVRELFDSHLKSAFTRDGEEIALSELALEVTDGDHSPPPKAPTGIPFITISNIVKHTREIDFSNTFSVPAEYFQGLKPNKTPRVGDILYTVTGATLGIPVLVREKRDFCFQRHIGLIRPKPETDSAWLTYALLSPQAFRQATIGSTGAAQKTVSLRVLRSLKMPKVPLAEQKRTAEMLDALTEENQRLTRVYERKLVATEALRKSLLHNAFNGEL